jgi:hypothetical protein
MHRYDIAMHLTHGMNISKGIRELLHLRTRWGHFKIVPGYYTYDFKFVDGNILADEVHNIAVGKPRCCNGWDKFSR